MIFSVPKFLEHWSIYGNKIACPSDGGHPYDCLLDQYDPGSTTAELSHVRAPYRTLLSSTKWVNMKVPNR